jgi:hypothetical protein
MIRSLAANERGRAFPAYRLGSVWPTRVPVVFAVLTWVIIPGGCRSSSRTQRASLRPLSEATIGQDLRRWPAGTTIPPAGLGVDLVESNHSVNERRDQMPGVLPPRLDVEARQAGSGASAMGPSNLNMHSSN